MGSITWLTKDLSKPLENYLLSNFRGDAVPKKGGYQQRTSIPMVLDDNIPTADGPTGSPPPFQIFWIHKYHPRLRANEL